MFLGFCGLMSSAWGQQKIVTGTVTSATEGEGALPCFYAQYFTELIVHLY